MKHIILCADDYGQNSSISQAIIDLIQKNRISATSCMTNYDYWKIHAKWLVPFSKYVDIGLHINLTEGRPLTESYGSDFSSLSNMLFKAYLRKLDKALIAIEIEAQLDEFVAKIGRLPNFIDGHQHVHQFPMIRDIIFDIYEKRLRESNCYIRSVYNPKTFWRFGSNGYFKSQIIQLSGALPFKRVLVKRNIPHNVSFEGFYDFSSPDYYPKLFQGFAERSANRGMIMCHPGRIDEEKDSMSLARYAEYQYLMSDQFEAFSIANQVKWTRFK